MGERKGIWKSGQQNYAFDFSDPSKLYTRRFVEWKEEQDVGSVLMEVESEVQKISLAELLGYEPVDEELLETSLAELKVEQEKTCFSCNRERSGFHCVICGKFCCSLCGGKRQICLFCLTQHQKKQNHQEEKKDPFPDAIRFVSLIFVSSLISVPCRMEALVFFLTHPEYTKRETLRDIVCSTLKEWGMESDSQSVEVFFEGLKERHQNEPKEVERLLLYMISKNRAFFDALAQYHQKLSQDDPFYKVYGRLMRESKAKGRKGRLDADAVKSCITRVSPPIVPEKIESVTSINALEVARQITLMEFEVFAAIQPSELLQNAWVSKRKEVVSPNVVLLTSRFNKLSNWISNLILQEKKPGSRALIIEYFIVVQRHLSNLNNFNALFEIHAALSSAHISRLRMSWEMIHPRELASFARINALISPLQNYSQYRKMLEACSGPCIPYIGPWLTDLVMLNEQPSWCLRDENRPFLNISKLQKVNDILVAMSRFQERMFPFEYVNDICNFISKALSETETTNVEKTLYDQSLVILNFFDFFFVTVFFQDFGASQSFIYAKVTNEKRRKIFSFKTHTN